MTYIDILISLVVLQTLFNCILSIIQCVGNEPLLHHFCWKIYAKETFSIFCRFSPHLILTELAKLNKYASHLLWPLY